jgi:hypothetical protein
MVLGGIFHPFRRLSWTRRGVKVPARDDFGFMQYSRIAGGGESRASLSGVVP